MTSREHPNLHTMVSWAKEDHIPAIRNIRTMSIKTQKVAREICGFVCVYARGLQRDAIRRNEFYAEAFPRGWKRFHRGKLLLHVLMYFYGVVDRHSDGYSTASAHSVALRDVYGNGDIPDDDVMRHIEASGIFSAPQDDHDADEGDDKEPSEDEANDADQEDDDADQETVMPRRIRTPSIFADEDELTENDKADEEESVTSDEADEVVRRPIRKAPKPAASLKRLPRSYIERCTLGWPATAAIGEAILEAVRNGKPVWVKLVPGEISDKYELYKDGGGFIQLSMEEFEVEEN